MSLLVLGINHQSAPVAIREKFAIPESRLGEFLRGASELFPIEEIVSLSTCNRVEIYAVSNQVLQARELLANYLCDFLGESVAIFQQHSYFYTEEAALRHGFRVASSLDSMILGESQILSQMKSAYQWASEAGTTGKILNKFFHQAFHISKKVRTETEIASHPVSVSYAAVILAKQIFGNLSDKKALVLGAGKMSELAIQHLKKSGIEKLFIANRTREHAEELAQKLGGETIPFEKFDKWLVDADIVISSTGSSSYLITASQVQDAIRERKNRPIFFIDIAVPRNVSPEVNHLPNVYLYDIDELGSVVEANKAERRREAERAAVLVDREVAEFSKFLKTLTVVPTLSSLSKKIEKICRYELDKAFQKLPELDADGREIIENLIRSVANKILHDPLVVLKEGQVESQEVDYSHLVRKLFRLDEIG